MIKYLLKVDINMDEFQFINKIKQDFYVQPSLHKGIGDDAAVIRENGQDIVTAVDIFVENIHFSRQTMQPFHIGYKALAANISDLAAMGATPAYYLVAVVIPKKWSEMELAEIFSGMQLLADRHNLDLIGGDTVSGNELTISITVIGYVNKDKARYRDQAKDGDIVFVTGTLGDSRAGLHILENPQTCKYKDEQYFIKRHQQPTPRIHFASALNNISRVTLNDISDGIANEAAEIAEASNVAIHLYDEKIPVHPSFKQFNPYDQYQWKYFGGEDFELLGTVPADDWPKVKNAAQQTNTKLNKIGYVLANGQGIGKVYIHSANNVTSFLPKKGYTHLK